MKGSIKFWMLVIVCTLGWIASASSLLFMMLMAFYLYASSAYLFLISDDSEEDPWRFLVPVYLIIVLICKLNPLLDKYFHPERVLLKRKEVFNEDHEDWDHYQDFLKERDLIKEET